MISVLLNNLNDDEDSSLNFDGWYGIMIDANSKLIKCDNRAFRKAPLLSRGGESIKLIELFISKLHGLAENLHPFVHVCEICKPSFIGVYAYADHKGPCIKNHFQKMTYEWNPYSSA